MLIEFSGVFFQDSVPRTIFPVAFHMKFCKLIWVFIRAQMDGGEYNASKTSVGHSHDSMRVFLGTLVDQGSGPLSISKCP